MYVTIKNGYNQTNPTTESLIDDLFENPDVNINDLSDFYFRPTQDETETLRTKTYIVYEENENMMANMSFINRESFTIANRLIKDAADIDINEIPNQYYTFKIPKKTHGFREINAPLLDLKERQRKVVNILQTYLGIQTHDSAWAYTKNRNIVGAMQEHTNNHSKWYLKIDLKNFFGSCNPIFIRLQLNKIYPFAYYESFDMIENIIKLACLNNELPQGTPLSPYLTNLIMVPIDYQINKKLSILAKEGTIKKQRYIYTRYADDIIISAKTKFEMQTIINAIKEILEGTPLRINEEKTRFGSNSGRNWNLGVMCNRNNDITIGYRKKQNIKAMAHNYNKDADNWTLHDLQYLLGQFSWLENVEPAYANKLQNYFVTKYGYSIKDNIVDRIKYKTYKQDEI